MTAPILIDQLEPLRKRVLAGDNRACFVERETILGELETPAAAIPGRLRYSWTLRQLLGRVSTPVESEDVVLGRMVEAVTPASAAAYGNGRWQDFVNWRIIGSSGHMTLDYPELLAEGLQGVARKARETADRLDTDEAWNFAENCGMCADAVEGFARRYAAAARAAAESAKGPIRANFLRAAAALDEVPHRPAKDFFSALQSVWLVHMIQSCYVGCRDMAFGRMDQYLLPFYERGLADGTLTPELARAFLAHFLMKTNEIPGTCAWNYLSKLIPCVGTKQYIFVGGSLPDGQTSENALSSLILEAAMEVRMRDPIIHVRLAPGSPPAFRKKTGAAAVALKAQVQFWNDAVIAPALHRKGVAREDAWDYSGRACSIIEIGARQNNHDLHACLASWMLEALRACPEQTASLDEVLARFREVAETRTREAIAVRRNDPEPAYDTPFINGGGLHFHFESMLLRDCVAQGKTHCAGAIRYRVYSSHFYGLATIINSFMTVKRLVFDERRFTLAQLLAITEKNFEGHETLRQEILHRVPKFGNDIDEVDKLARAVGDAIADAGDAVMKGCLPKELFIVGIHSTFLHQVSGKHLPATPDGRLKGEPTSENLSPTYGTDTTGITALLKSTARLPFDRINTGSGNVKFAGKIEPEMIAALLQTYFQMGGLMLAPTFVDRTMLEDARAHPEQYRSLLVRLHGFSEYFTALPDNEQQELIQRTEY